MKKSFLFILVTLACWMILAIFRVPFVESETIQDKGLLYLKNLSISELASLEVTSVSKTQERMADADAAIYVITSEDIRRSGLTSIPELLRMVPGLQVAHIDSNKWAISSRGFNGWYADKLLVLIDGRSVYTPLFSGVNWDIQDTLLDDIERIEVIRGPGATLWGANAVNGVINIITKRAQETQGGLLKAGGGNLEQGFGGLRYGGKIGTVGWYRVYAKYFNRDAFKTKDGHDAKGEWDMGRAGFRADLEPSVHDSFTLQGDIYSGNTHDYFKDLPSQKSPFNDDVKTDLDGGNILGRWHRHLSDTSALTFQVYYDRTERRSIYIKETRDNFDLDFQHSFHVFKRHNIIWGLEYRLTHDNIPTSSVFIFDPKSRTDHLYSGFVQDQISIIKGRLDLTLGTKLEHNDYSGFEIQPSVRLRFKPDKYQTFWAAVSRAVRTPSRAEHDMNFVLRRFEIGPSKNILLLRGNRDFDSEKLIAYELGYRIVPQKRFSFDIATFYNVYHDLRTTAPGPPESGDELFHEQNVKVIPVNIINRYHEDVYGIEVTGTVQVTPWWKASASYSWLKLNLHTKRTVMNLEVSEGSVPRNQFSLKSYMDLPHNLQLDTLLFYVDGMPDMHIPGYTRLDLRLGWNPMKNLSISLKLENLLDNQHQEYRSIGNLAASEVPRSFYGKITWHF